MHVRTFPKGVVVVNDMEEGPPRELGKGAFATVFEVGGEAHKLAHFGWEVLLRRERRLLKGLSHPNVIRWLGDCDAYDVDRVRMVPGIRLPLLPHGNLYEEMVAFRTAHPGTRPGLPMDRVARVLVDCLRALSYLHGVGVRHRDVKPENLMWDGERYVLVDFNCGSYTCVPAVGKYIQSLTYRAPENLLRCPIGVASTFDEWALGCVLCELLLNKPLFHEPNELRVLQAIRMLLGPIPESMVAAATNDDVVRGGRLRPRAPPLRTHPESMCTALRVALDLDNGLGDAIVRVVSATLVCDPSQRATASALLRALEGNPLLDNEP